MSRFTFDQEGTDVQSMLATGVCCACHVPVLELTVIMSLIVKENEYMKTE